MSQSSSRHDAWSAGDNYQAYMGRWSQRVAERFLEWLAPAPGLHWLDVGCGTGALSGSIVSRCAPASLIGIDPSEGFVSAARRNVPEPIAAFKVGDAQQLPLTDGDRDIAASALVLNFVPDRVKALTEMRRVVRPGSTIAFYVWDYPGRGVEFMGAFWKAAIALNPAAADLAENTRFPFCTPDGLRGLCTEAGLPQAEVLALQVPTTFKDFDDYWHPFTLGTGPAPGYCANLPGADRELLRARLEADLPRGKDGTIPLQARAWGVRVRT